MIVEKVIEKAMKKAQGAQATLSRSESYDVAFEYDKIKSSRSDQNVSMNLKVIINGKVGNSYTRDVNDIDGLVDRALETAALGSKSYYDFPGPQEGVDVKIYDKEILPVTKEMMVSMGEEMISMMKDYNPNIITSAKSGKYVASMEFANSNGQSFTSEDTTFGAYTYGQIIKENDMFMLDGFDYSRKRSLVDHKVITEKTIDLFRKSEKIVEIKSGNMPVIFTPEGMVLLQIALNLGINGKNVFMKSSPLVGRIGEKIADDCFTLYDDPLVDYAMSSSKFDQDGVARRKNMLIENGVLKGFLYDLETAARAGTESTGNGTGCNPTNIIIREGSESFEDIIKNTKEGLLVYNFIGAGQSNIISGEFSVNVGLGFKIENGQIEGRVKNIMLAGNVYDAIKNIDALGDKAEWMPGQQNSLCSPHVKIGSLSVIAN